MPKKEKKNKQESKVNELLNTLNEEHKFTQLHYVAKEYKKIYDSQIQVGFTPNQAMQILLLLITLANDK